MTDSLMQWHLARDDQAKLAKFCSKHRIYQDIKTYTGNDGEYDYFQITYHFNNNSYIRAELRHGTKDQGFSVADHFQVLDYGWAQQ